MPEPTNMVKDGGLYGMLYHDEIRAGKAPNHWFNDQGICLGCGVDAENWDLECGLQEPKARKFTLAELRAALDVFHNEDCDGCIAKQNLTAFLDYLAAGGA